MSTIFYYATVSELTGDARPHRIACEYPGKINIKRPVEQVGLVEVCANDYYFNHNGKNCRWPITFELYAAADGLPLGRIEAHLYYEPCFTGFRLPDYPRTRTQGDDAQGKTMRGEAL